MSNSLLTGHALFIKKSKKKTRDPRENPRWSASGREKFSKFRNENSSGQAWRSSLAVRSPCALGLLDINFNLRVPSRRSTFKWVYMWDPDALVLWIFYWFSPMCLAHGANCKIVCVGVAKVQVAWSYTASYTTFIVLLASLEWCN